MPMRVLRQCLLLALYLKHTRHVSPSLIHTSTVLEISIESYLMVLPVLKRIHCGMGRFCFCARASFCFVRKDLWDCHVLVSIYAGPLLAMWNVRAS